MNFYEVFTPGGVPTYTYNPREVYSLEMKIMQAKRNLCKLMIVTGQTKMGKTVLAEKVYSRGTDSIWVDGGEISDEESFWDNIVSQLELPTQYENQDSGHGNYHTIRVYKLATKIAKQENAFDFMTTNKIEREKDRGGM